jgi:dTMP kinase
MPRPIRWDVVAAANACGSITLKPAKSVLLQAKKVFLNILLGLQDCKPQNESCKTFAVCNNFRKTKMANGTFIAIEGIDGSGKGTICQMLADELGKRFKVILTAEPSNSPFGKKLRLMLAKDKNPSANAEKYMDLFVKDREHHCKNTLLPALASGFVVLCDRYKYSTLAFQSAQGIPPQKIIKMHKGLPVPDLAIILDVTPRIAMARMEGRGKKKEKFEKLEFMRTLRANYSSLPKLLPKENIKKVNANKPVKQVFSAALKLVEKQLAKAQKAAARSAG